MDDGDHLLDFCNLVSDESHNREKEIGEDCFPWNAAIIIVYFSNR